MNVMKLEEAIKQTKGFKDEWQKALLNIIYTGNWIYGHQTRNLKPYGISPEQYNILRILKGQHPNPATVNLLKERMLDKMSNASRLVEKLRQKGYVERKECKEDRRRVDVKITDQGLKVLEAISQQAMIENDILREKINEEEAQTLNTILDKIRS